MTACQEQQKQAELSEKHSLKADIFLLENTDTPAISATVFNFFLPFDRQKQTSTSEIT